MSDVQRNCCLNCGKPIHRVKGRCRPCAAHERWTHGLAKLSAQFPVGGKYGLWEVTGTPAFRPDPRHNKPRWFVAVRCGCGTEKDVLCQNLLNGESVSCFQCGHERSGELRAKHGGSRSQLYKVWNGMLTRCRCPGHESYKHYGGRGIFVCEGWQEDFTDFRDWALANGWRPGLEIDRRDNDGPYSPENCRLVTRGVNNRNKRTNRMMEAFGESKLQIEWAEDPRCVVGKQTLMARLRYGWPLERAMTIPVMSRRESLRAARAKSPTTRHLLS